MPNKDEGFGSFPTLDELTDENLIRPWSSPVAPVLDPLELQAASDPRRRDTLATTDALKDRIEEVISTSLSDSAWSRTSPNGPT